MKHAAPWMVVIYGRTVCPTQSVILQGRVGSALPVPVLLKRVLLF